YGSIKFSSPYKGEVIARLSQGPHLDYSGVLLAGGPHNQEHTAPSLLHERSVYANGQHRRGQSSDCSAHRILLGRRDGTATVARSTNLWRGEPNRPDSRHHTRPGAWAGLDGRGLRRP